MHLTNISVVWADSSGWLIHITSAQLKLEGHCSPPAVLNIITSQTQTRIRRRGINPEESVDYCELNFSITANTNIPNIGTDKCHIFIKRPHCIFNPNFFNHFFNTTNKLETQKPKTHLDTQPNIDLRKYIPKVRSRAGLSYMNRLS